MKKLKLTKVEKSKKRITESSSSGKSKLAMIIALRSVIKLTDKDIKTLRSNEK